MDDYIEREALLKAMSYHNYYPKGKHFLKGIETAEEIIEHFPSADVQPVLRCKDCKEWHRNYLAIDGGKHGCELFQDFTRPDDFCSFGTRMDGVT